MASAMIQGLLDRGLYQPSQISCTSAADGSGESLAAATGITFTTEMEPLLEGCDVIVLAIKPQQLAELPATSRERVTGQLLISILAGKPLARLQEAFPASRNIVRAMPNTPGQIGVGITAFACLKPLQQDDQSLVGAILGALGEVVPTEEKHLDAVTAVSGSGPAFVARFIAALRDAGIAEGLPANVAMQLALQTARGTGRLLAHTGDTPENLIAQVSSPGGTTVAGLAKLEEGDLSGLVQKTIRAAAARSRELAQ